MTEPDLRQEVTEAYLAYIRAFLGNDLPGINAVVRYPLAYIGDGEVLLLDTFPVNPADLMAAKQWHSSTNTEFEVVGVSPTKAHVLLPRAQRLRRDGSLIETVSAFYAFTKTPEGWKMFAFSDVTVPT